MVHGSNWSNCLQLIYFMYAKHDVIECERYFDAKHHICGKHAIVSSLDTYVISGGQIYMICCISK